MSTYLSSGSRCRTRAAGSHMAWAAGLALLGCSAGGAWAQTTLVSTSAGGLQGNGESAALSEEQLITVSADGCNHDRAATDPPAHAVPWRISPPRRMSVAERTTLRRHVGRVNRRRHRQRHGSS